MAGDKPGPKKGSRPRKSSGKRADQEQREKQAQALRLRMGGASYAEIAKELGYAQESGAWRLVHSALKEITREPAEEVLVLELQRLDRLQRGYWLNALRGDVRAGQTILRIMDRRAALLGLDTVTFDAAADVKQALRELLGAPPSAEELAAYSGVPGEVPEPPAGQG